MLEIIGILLIILVIVFAYVHWQSGKSTPPPTTTTETPVVPTKKKDPQPSAKKPQAPKVLRHFLCVQEIKDSKYSVESFAIDPNQNYIATVTEEKLIQLHYLTDKRIIKHKMEDSANRICVSGDGNHLVVALTDSKELRAFRIVKKGTTQALESAREFPNKHQKADIISLQMSNNNRYLISCGNDTTINVWSVKGILLSTINTRQMQNYQACISPDSQMIAAAAHMSDIRVWKFRATKDKNEQVGVEDRVFTHLRGHTSFIYWIAFSSDSKKLLTCSKDNTWKLWDLNVNFAIEELPKVIMSKNIANNGVYTRVEISYDDNYFIALTDNSTTIHLWDLNSGEQTDTIKSSHFGHITNMAWYPKEHKFATSGSDGVIKIYDIHNRK